jgi:hypothetical protein
VLLLLEMVARQGFRPDGAIGSVDGNCAAKPCAGFEIDQAMAMLPAHAFSPGPQHGPCRAAVVALLLRSSQFGFKPSSGTPSRVRVRPVSSPSRDAVAQVGQVRFCE